MTRRVSILLALLLLMAPLALEAQVRPPPGGQRNRQQLLRRVEQGFARLVETRLDLSGDQMTSLQNVMESFREDRREISQAQASLRHRLRDPALPNLEEEAARDLLREMIQVREAEVDLYRREQAALLQVLSPTQLVGFYRLRDEWAQRVQQLRGQQGRGPGGSGPPGVPPGTGGMNPF